jgi:hypothetical protein
MNKYWIALFLAIAATQTFAGEKEYTFRGCDYIDGWYADVKRDCNDCKVVEGAKKAFKVSKELNSVMQININADGTSKSSVIENCKIFDENNFQCLTEQEATYLKDFFDLGMIDKLVVSNGKWESTFILKGMHNGKYGKNLKKGEHVTPEGKSQSYSCGYEIKNSFNFFK